MPVVDGGCPKIYFAYLNKRFAIIFQQAFVHWYKDKWASSLSVVRGDTNHGRGEWIIITPVYGAEQEWEDGLLHKARYC
jgi:hypothetical protein